MILKKYIILISKTKISVLLIFSVFFLRKISYETGIFVCRKYYININALNFFIIYSTYLQTTSFVLKTHDQASFALSLS